MKGFILAAGGPVYAWVVTDPKAAANFKARLEAFPPDLNKQLVAVGLGSITFIFSPQAVTNGKPNMQLIDIRFEDTSNAFFAAWNTKVRSGLTGCEVIPIPWGDNRHDLYVVAHSEGRLPYETIADLCFESVVGGFETWQPDQMTGP